MAELDPSIADGDLPTVTADADQLRVLLANLLDNARQFAATACTVHGVGRRPRESGDAWRVEVVDDGRGVPAEDRERVFEPMVRLDKTEPGTGVGLATCRRIVEAHGGRIGLDEAPDGGTRRLVRAAGGALVLVRLARQVEHPLQRDQRLAARSRGSTSIWLTTVPATSDSIAHTKCGRSIRFIVEQ